MRNTLITALAGGLMASAVTLAALSGGGTASANSPLPDLPNGIHGSSDFGGDVHFTFGDCVSNVATNPDGFLAGFLGVEGPDELRTVLAWCHGFAPPG